MENFFKFKKNNLKKVLEVGLAASITTTPMSIPKTEEKDLEKKNIRIETPKTVLKKEFKTKQEFIDYQIQECKKIIEGKKYEEVINHPYLVSALYYSEKSIKKISHLFSQLNGPEEIISGISPFITKDFRENYINTLKKLIEEKDLNHSVNTKESPPLTGLRFNQKTQGNHADAIDLFVEEGSPVYSMSGGIVVLAENGWEKNDDASTSSYKGGNTVIIFNPYNESFYRYEHLENAEVMPGTIVSNNTRIGKVGHTGINASRPGHGGHLHLEINKYNNQKNIMEITKVSKIQKRLMDTLR